MKWPENLDLPKRISLEDFYKDLASQGYTLPAHNGELCRLVLISKGKTLSLYKLYERVEDNSVHKCISIEPEEDFIRKSLNQSILNDKGVIIIGCGSLGSKIACSLARSGVNRFLLVDDDFIYPGNLTRHDLDLTALVRHKTDAVAEKVELVNSKAKCKKSKLRLGAQESSGGIDVLFSSFLNYDLVIDATAESKVFNLLSAVVENSKIPMIWGQVFGGGIGGLIARYRPTIEPNPQIVRQMIENWCAERHPPIKKVESKYGGDEIEEPLIANDSDVSVIAAHATNMALDLLLKRTPTDFPFSAYMIGLSKGWIFSEVFDTFPISIPPLVESREEAIDNSAEKLQALNEIRQIYTNYKDETNNNS